MYKATSFIPPHQDCFPTRGMLVGVYQFWYLHLKVESHLLALGSYRHSRSSHWTQCHCGPVILGQSSCSFHRAHVCCLLTHQFCAFCTSVPCYTHRNNGAWWHCRQEGKDLSHTGSWFSGNGPRKNSFYMTHCCPVTQGWRVNVCLPEALCCT